MSKQRLRDWCNCLLSLSQWAEGSKTLTHDFWPWTPSSFHLNHRFTNLQEISSVFWWYRLPWGIHWRPAGKCNFIVLEEQPVCKWKAVLSAHFLKRPHCHPSPPPTKKYGLNTQLSIPITLWLGSCWCPTPISSAKVLLPHQVQFYCKAAPLSFKHPGSSKHWRGMFISLYTTRGVSCIGTMHHNGVSAAGKNLLSFSLWHKTVHLKSSPHFTLLLRHWS